MEKTFANVYQLEIIKIIDKFLSFITNPSKEKEIKDV